MLECHVSITLCSITICSSKCMINKSNTSDTEAPLLNLNVSISNDIRTNKISDKRDDSDFDIVICFHSYDVYISQLIRFAKSSC